MKFTAEKIKEYESIDKLLATIGPNTESLTFKDIDLTDDKVIKIITYIINCCPSLDFLSLPNLKFTDQCANIIADLILKHPKLDTLNLEGNCLTDKGIQTIADALISNNSLTFISFINNHHTVASIELLMRVTEINYKLYTIMAFNEASNSNAANPSATLSLYDRQMTLFEKLQDKNRIENQKSVQQLLLR